MLRVLRVFLYITILLYVGKTQVYSKSKTLYNENQQANLSGYTFYFIDTTNELSFKDIDDRKFSLSQETRSLDFGLTSSTVWLKFSVNNHSDIQKWILEIDYALIEHCTLYQVKQSSVLKSTIGSGEPFSNREIKTRTLAFPLMVDSLSTYYMQLKSGHPIKVPLKVYNSIAFYKKVNNDNIVFMIYYAFIIAMFVMNIIFYITIRDNIHLIYSFALLGFGIGLGTDSGLSYMYLWPDSPSFNIYSNPIIGSITFALMNWFMRKLLLSKVYAPMTDKIVLLFQYFGFGWAIISPLLFSTMAAQTTLFLTTVLSFPFIITIGAKAWRAGYTPAKYYFLGWLGLAIGVTIFVLDFTGVFPNTIASYGLYIGSVLEITFFAVSLGMRFRILEKREQSYKDRLANYKEQVLNKTSEQTNLPEHLAKLSTREEEVLSNIAIGLSDKEIAERLFISVTTVKTHARSIFSKLDVKNRTEAVVVANKYQLVNINTSESI